jgi:hypothetical protein
VRPVSETTVGPSELYRLRGEIVLGSGGAVEQAAHHFSRALEIARAPNANPLCLRSALSIARTVKLGDKLGASALPSLHYGPAWTRWSWRKRGCYWKRNAHPKLERGNDGPLIGAPTT